MRALRSAHAVIAAVLGCTVFAACGARDAPHRRVFGKPLPADGGITDCLDDLDCGTPDLCNPVHCVAGACVAGKKVVCDDQDPCTTDSCDPTTGLCDSKSLTRDEDGDGHRGPIPGFAPGAPGSCGDDCDDTSPLAHPGATEKCDGVDNDCNGIVDDGARYEPAATTPVLLSTADKQAGLGGIAFGGREFAVSFAAQGTGWSNTFTTFSPEGAITLPPTSVTHVNTDSFSGPLVWTGAVFGLVWEDRRDQDFEIYFNRIDATGKKLAPDLRVTNAPKFSLRPDVVWDGAEYIVVWADTRDGEASGLVLGQRIDAEGHLVGPNVRLTEKGDDADGPRLARGQTELGLVFNRTGPFGRQIAFRTLSPDLTKLGPVVTVSSQSSAASSAVAWSGDRYVVVWDTLKSSPGPTIRGAAVSASGSGLVSERDVTSGAGFSRSEAILPLGDRLLLVWAEQSGGPYSLHSKMIASDLTSLTPSRLVTSSPSDSMNPELSFGPTGVVGVAFEDRRTGAFQVYSTRLECVAGN
jgi:hypothetical protein